ncbi:hypothetical protein N7453_002764 [Penicillium expansum]|nr:hypothetical protein N7453_002764 [Penicillium expansum]
MQPSDWCDGDEVVKLEFKSSNDFYEARSVVSRPIQWKEGGVLNPECPANATFKMFNDQIQSIQLLLVVSNDSTQNSPTFQIALKASILGEGLLASCELLVMDFGKFKST